MASMNPYSALYGAISGDLYTKNAGYWYGGVLSGKSQRDSTQASLQQQINYEQYLKAGNARALRDWYRNVGYPNNRKIAYPEFSYPGQIRRADTSIARASLDYANADSNYYGNLIYRGAGLYGIAGRLTRSL